MELPSADEVMRRWRVADVAQTLLPRLHTELTASSTADMALRGQQHGGILAAADALERAAGIVVEISRMPRMLDIEPAADASHAETGVASNERVETLGLDVWTAVHAGRYSNALDMLDTAGAKLSAEEQRDIRESIGALAHATSLLDAGAEEAVRVLMALHGDSASTVILSKAACLWTDSDARSNVVLALCSLCDALGADPVHIVTGLAREASPAQCLSVSASLVAQGRSAGAARAMFDAWWRALPRPLDICALLDAARSLIAAFHPEHGSAVAPPNEWLKDIAAECEEALARVKNPGRHMLLLRHLMPGCPVTVDAGLAPNEPMPSFVPTNLPRLAKL